MTGRVTWQMRASGLAVALLGIGGVWMTVIYGSELLDLLVLTPADPFRMNDWRGWFAILAALLGAPLLLYAGVRLMLFRRMPEPDITPKATRRRVVIVLSLVVLAAGLGLVVQKISISRIESLGWEQCYVKQTSWRFGKELFSSSCESHGLMKLDQALDKLSLEALKDKLNKEMFEQE